jgi:hypothetical protein
MRDEGSVLVLPVVDLNPAKVAEELRQREANRQAEQDKMMADIERMKAADKSRPEIMDAKPPPGWPPTPMPRR